MDGCSATEKPSIRLPMTPSINEPRVNGLRQFAPRISPRPPVEGSGGEIGNSRATARADRAAPVGKRVPALQGRDEHWQIYLACSSQTPRTARQLHFEQRREQKIRNE